MNNLNLIIEKIYTDEYNSTAINELCKSTKLPAAEFCDAVARDIVEGYISKTYSWPFCNNVMHKLYWYGGYTGKDIFSEYANEVFLAIEAGETKGEKTPESYVQPFIDKIVAKYHNK